MSKIILIISVLIAGSLALVMISRDDTAPVQSSQAPAADISEPEVYLDVRTTVEYDMGHIDGAVNFNVDRLRQGEVPDYPLDTAIAVYCRSGNRSAEAKQLLEQAGFTNITDIGAFSDWEEAGKPTAKTTLIDHTELLDQIDSQPIAVLGLATAPVTIKQYADFACPYSARFVTETESQIIANYVESGKVKIEYHTVAYQGSEADTGAQAGYCANEQGKFWDFQQTFNQAFVSLGESAFESASLNQTALASGLDIAVFSDCLESQRYSTIVSMETMANSNKGIDGTPMFQIGGQTIEGAYPYQTFVDAIESELGTI